MKSLKMAFISTLVLLFNSNFASAASNGGLGINVGVGVPFLSQAGVDYMFSDQFGIHLGYNNLTLTAGEASVALTMPELVLTYHPFSGAFFIGAGVGQETLVSKAKDTATGLEAKIEITANTTIGKIGWMWGVADGGFWFGIDASFVSPSGSKNTITAPGLSATDEAYQDAVESADKFGSTSYSNITFARLGYLF